MSKKFDPNIKVNQIKPLSLGVALFTLFVTMLLIGIGLIFSQPLVDRDWIAKAPMTQIIFVASYAAISLAAGVTVLYALIRRNVIGMECTVGLVSLDSSLYYFHRPGLIMTYKQQPLIIYSHIRLGGWGNSERLFPIYCLGTDGEAEQPISPSLRVTSDGWFELVQMQSKTCIGGPIYSLLVHAFHNAGGFDVFGAQTALNQSKNEVATLRRRLDWLGVPLVAVQHRLEVVRAAQQSQHAELTSDLCHIALENIPQAQQDAWLFTAQERWPHIFHERKKGDPKVTLNAPTPPAEVTA